MTREDVQETLGEVQANTLPWINHDALDPGLVFLGSTSRGTPVWVSRLAVQADHVILTGSVVHHYFAGFGGGRKCLIPGIAGLETALANHKLALGSSTRGLHPACTPGNLSANPVHEDLMEACEMLPPSFLLNVVLNPAHQILYATAGDWRSAHLEACALADSIYSVSIPGQAELVLTSCGGFPKDINLIQAHKTLDHAFCAVKPGKVLILLAECSQGIGSRDYQGWFGHESLPAMEQAVQAAYSIHGHTALTTLAKARSISVILVSGLPRETVRTFGMLPATSVNEALAIAYKILGGRPPQTFVFPYGSLTIPRLTQLDTF
jgi:nickel-dependent lactate racemase